jgi:hypothetical protein
MSAYPISSIKMTTTFGPFADSGNGGITARTSENTMGNKYFRDDTGIFAFSEIKM